MDKNIQSLLSSGYSVQIIVADNCSTDDTVSIVEKYPQVTLLKMTSNLGFGKANNLGIKEALAKGADYVFLLNQDAWVFNNTISSLIKKMEQLPDLGILSPVHFSGDAVNLDESFKVYWNRKIKEIEPYNIDEVPFVNAAAWMVSRNCIEKTGYFEPLFRHYGEDRNYCYRAGYHGFKIGIDKDSHICHDRIIVRNFNKDIVQSKYRILTTLLNINRSLSGSYLIALKEVFGLPKYFSKYYGFGKSVNLFFKLLGYYITQIFKCAQIIKARNNAK